MKFFLATNSRIILDKRNGSFLRIFRIIIESKIIFSHRLKGLKGLKGLK